jgi:signal transduction histidine kinase
MDILSNSKVYSMNKTLMFFVLLTVAGIVHAQQAQIDSLLRVLPEQSASGSGHLIMSYTKLGQLYLAAGRFDSALVYLHKARQLARAENNRRDEMQVDQLLAGYFSKTVALDSTLYYTHHAMEIEREIFRREKSEEIAALQMLHNDNQKDQELIFQKKIVRRQFAAIIGVTLILILTIIFGFKLYRLNKNNAQANNALLALNKEINQMNENLESLVLERTEEINIQNQKLIEYTFFTAHEIRGPVARILGLIELAKLQDLNDEDKDQIMVRMEEASNELDEVIRTINRKLEKENRY